MVAAEQGRRLHHLQVEQRLQQLVAGAAPAGLPDDGDAQRLAGRGAAGRGQAVQGQQATSEAWRRRLGRVAVEDVLGREAGQRARGGRGGRVWGRRGGGWRRLARQVGLVQGALPCLGEQSFSYCRHRPKNILEKAITGFMLGLSMYVNSLELAAHNKELLGLDVRTQTPTLPRMKTLQTTCLFFYFMRNNVEPEPRSPSLSHRPR